jgi:hypothetical protein
MVRTICAPQLDKSAQETDKATSHDVGGRGGGRVPEMMARAWLLLVCGGSMSCSSRLMAMMPCMGVRNSVSPTFT